MKAVGLTPRDLRRCPPGLGVPQGALTVAQKSADGVVGHDVGTANEALRRRKVEKRIGQGRER
jgi:hypothetical protein